MSYQAQIKIVPGKKTKDILLFSLSTCMWCERTEELFKELGLEYGHVMVDFLEPADQQEVTELLSKYDANVGFPVTLINNGEKVIVGFDEAELRKLANG